jgi:hypothetical protein
MSTLCIRLLIAPPTQVLRELSIPMKMCDGDSQPVILGMSRSMKCGVLSRDSAYFLHEVPQGYVPIHRVQIKSGSLIMQVLSMLRHSPVHRAERHRTGLQLRIISFRHLWHEAPARASLECTGRRSCRPRERNSPFSKVGIHRHTGAHHRTHTRSDTSRTSSSTMRKTLGLLTLRFMASPSG